LALSGQHAGCYRKFSIAGGTRPQAGWVVLSACHTAADDGSGETLSGLARTFSHAGAAARLVSQWSVDDVATRVLRTEVFGQIKQTHPNHYRVSGKQLN
jgi:CHAT domain-containing protein